ncbi:SDR family NAD(P)-dependent oxidoreductase, partial [Streptomyces sp. URMC 126]|uniref:SDR family NAD(P)-dependent oxidoreductase n=2 Tax=Streptomyces sp. URMC 126 TaxID=3423401 RepID=UPI003F1AA5B3
RLLLETSWEALEDAGIDPGGLRGSDTGVFTGLFYHDYLPSHGVPEEVEGYLGTGGTGSVASGRVAYTLGLEGPAVTVDTACSSSLVALHLACQSLRSGESSLALAGGVTVMSTPGTFIDFSRQRGLAADGRCKAYAEGADGTGWGEGVGVLVVERLSDARRNGHKVLAVVTGTAVNQDGASNGLTAPNGPSQQRVVRAALASAGVGADGVDVVEGHGTGTRLGDPIEAQALLATYGQGRPADRPLLLGSVKSNIGHAQAAAGVAGVIKMVAAMRHGVVPATLHADEPSSRIDWDAGAVRLVTEAVPWPETGERPRRAGVSSFGFSGTNAHVIIEQAPRETSSVTASDEGSDGLVLPVVPWVVSGRSAAGLVGQADRLAEFVRQRPEVGAADVGRSLVTSRGVLEHRAVVLGTDRDELEVGLKALAEGREALGVVSGIAGGAGKVGFVFTGQGAQRMGMGQGLYAAFPVFAAAFDAVCAGLAEHLDGSLAAVIRGEGEESWPGGGRIDETVWAQAGLFAVEVALFRLLESWGVTPQVVAGHSIGELAAAYVAGVWSLADACAVVAARGRLMQELPVGGAMVAVEADEQRVLEVIAGRSGVGIAAVNGPKAVVISGVEDEVLAVAEMLAEGGARTRRLRVSHAFHSPLMEPMLEDFARVVESVTFHAPRLPLVSALTGKIVGDEVTDPSYWVRHVREAVRFADAASALREHGVRTFIEIGPDGVLSGMGPHTRSDVEGEGAGESWLPVLRRGREESRALFTALAKVFVRGVPVDWDKIYAPTGARRVDLPTYAFQRQRYWLPIGSGVVDAAGLGQSPGRHPLLGAVVTLPVSGGVLLTGRLSLSGLPWLADHVVAGQVVVPGAALVEMVVRAGDEAGCGRIEELLIESPLVLTATAGVRVQVAVEGPDETGRRAVAVYAQAEDAAAEEEWVRHAVGVLAPTGPVADTGNALTQWPPTDAVPVDLEGFYPALAERGLAYGPVFQGVCAAWRRGEELFAEVALPEGVAVSGFGVHPALLDAALHVATLGVEGDGLVLPFAWGDVVVHASGASVARVRVVPVEAGEGVSVTLADAGGGLIASVGSLVLRPFVAGAGSAGASLFGVEWVPAAVVGEPVGELAELGAGGVAGLVESGEAPPVVVLRVVPEAGSAVADAARAVAVRVLGVVREWLAAEELAGSRLVVVTERAVDAGGSLEVAASSVWGLVRVAQSEHPGRLVLADVEDLSAEGVGDWLRAGLATGEPQFAVRSGQVRVPRLVRAGGGAPVPAVGGGTVLVTGASGALGGLVARHLARTGRAERLLLLSRRGIEAAGMRELVAELSGLGVEAAVVACDAADRERLAVVLEGVPLAGVVHAAGVLDDGLVQSLTAGRLEAVLRPKVDAAWNLHELTRDLDLHTFVLFSSVAGVIGNAGQANYAAGNTFLDALAAHRRHQGLPAVSVAWGAWERGMAGTLTDADRQRMARQGILPLTDTHGLALLDAATARPEPLLVAAQWDLTAIHRSREVPPLLSTLVHTTRSGPQARRMVGQATSEAKTALLARLSGLTPAEQQEKLRDIVVTQAALVLGMAGSGAVDSSRSFRDVGFDSLTAVELRGRLNYATGLQLPATAVFDYPTPAALAEFVLRELLGGTGEASAGSALAVAGGGLPVDDDPVVIVGMGCRFPGGVSSPGEFWELLESGGDAIGPFPAQRGWAGNLHDPDPDAPGKSVAEEGGFLYDAGEFDAEFFGVSPREAVAMDPQQRLLLETSWEALEDAGIDPGGLRGSDTGVFTGLFYHDYLPSHGVPEEVEGYLGTGGTGSVASGRVAYTLGLEGPAVTVDTACSSSLVALHLACQSLRSGESSLALAGGVTVMSTPGTFIDFSRQRGLAADGRCKAYAEGADGTGWGEGVGVLVIERLSDARRNGHKVLAVVSGSAVNQDGASNGLTAPNGPSQQRVIRAALASAGLTPADVDVVEGHGTGTRLGDPIEAQALLATYGQGRPADRPLLLGSVKSNIGHAQAAAGVAGVIKMVAAMRHGVVPATLHVGTPSSHVDWNAGAVHLATENMPWPDAEHPRRAGVSSFGFSGTNAHVILEQAPRETPTVTASDEDPAGLVLPVVPWVVSGRSAAGLVGQADRLAEFVRQRPDVDAADVGWSLASSRGVLEHRAVVLGTDRDELEVGLKALTESREALGVVTGIAGGAGKVGFVFTGQGAQRMGMGQGLYAAFPVFAAAFDAVCAGLAEHLDGSLAAVIRGEGEESWPGGGRIDETVWAQAGLFAVEVALFRLLESWGVTPQAVAGHSIGELAAAYVAGVWSLADACAVVAARGRLMQELPSGGAMVAIEADENKVLAAIAGRTGVGIAAVNGPKAIVISGAEDEVLAAAEELARSGARTRRLRVSHAFHSPLMEPMLERFAEVVRSVSYRAPRLTFVSALTGEAVTHEVTDPAYWVRHVREAVRFADAASALREHGVRTFIEIGPDGILSGMGPHTRTDTETESDTNTNTTTDTEGPGPAAEAWLPVLRRGRDEPRALFTALANAFVRGVPVGWDKVYAPTGARRVDLPTYAFQRQHYWLAPTTGSRAEDLGLESPRHPLLGAAVELPATGGVVLTGRLAVSTQPWLAQSLVTGRPVVPVTALVDMAVRAGDETDCGQVEEFVVEAPLVLPERGDVRVQVTVGEAGPAGRREVAVFARAADGEWVRHASGALAPADADGRTAVDTADWTAQWPPAGALAVDVDGLYEGLAAAGLGYGPVFHGVREAWRRGDELFVAIALPDGVNTTGFGVHPALLDAALHLTALDQAAVEGPSLPLLWSGVHVYASDAVAARVRVAPSASGEGVAVMLVDAAGQPIASVASVVPAPLAPGALDRAAGPVRDGLFRVEWVPTAAAEGAGEPGRTWAVLGEDGRLGVPGAAVYADVARLVAAVEAGAAVPDVVVAACRVPGPGHGDTPPAAHPVDTTALTGTAADRLEDAARSAALRVLEVVREWLAAGVLDGSRLVVVTERGVDTGPGVGVRMDSAGVTGLVRAAAGEHPERIVLADVAVLEGSGPLVVAGTALGEPEFAVRDGQLWVRRLAHAAGDGLPVPEGTHWRLGVSERGAVENLVLAEHEDGRRPLAAGELRVAVRAAGVNFHDVLNVLGEYPGEAGPLGLEGTGVVLETGPGVVEPAVGDTVMGLLPGAFGTVAVADARTVTRVPAGWSPAEAAGAPMAFLTAYHALVELAGLRRGERVLIHAAAGGVGMAAVRVARHLGAEVYATASPSKWPALRELGLDARHVASSRTAEFEEAFRAESGGRGMDVVLNSLTGESVDASLRLVRPGGRFVELGKADVRDPGRIERDHRITYLPCDLLLKDPGAIGGMLSSLSELFATGALAPLPVTCWDVRRAVDAFRFVGRARQVGKVVLTVPAPAGRAGTVLVTGASGALGGLVARHLAATGRARRVLLASRRGMGASGMPELVAELAGSGTSVRVVACDVADRDQLAQVIAGVSPAAPLTGVVHTAGVLDDGVVQALTPDRLRHVMRPKADAAWHLHELTRHLDLDTFTLFSSVAGVWGTPGQANYAAGNTFLDALAAHRRHQGLAAVSLAWGPWEQGMAGGLADAERQRMGRQGLRPLTAPDGLALLDAAADRTDPLLVTARLDLPALRRLGSAVPALVTGLVRPGRRTAAGTGPQTGGDAANRWAALPPEQLDGALLDLVLTQAALVLGRPGPESIEAGRYFRQLGFDSLTALQFRNRVSAALGLRLPAAVVFDYPTPAELAGYLRERVAELEIDYEPVLGELDKLKSLLSAIVQRGGKKVKIMSRLEVLVEEFRDASAEGDGAPDVEDISGATDDEIFDLIDKELGI